MKRRSNIERPTRDDPLHNFSSREPSPTAKKSGLGKTVLLLGIGGAFLVLLPNASFPQSSLATDCTLYAAATGIDSNAGTSPTAPKTLTGASAVSQPGSVICLQGGTYTLSSPFYPATSGTPTAWIVYKNYGDSDVRIVWTGGTSGSDINMFHFWGKSQWTGRNYIEVRGLKFDGQNASPYAFKCKNSHHLRFVGNSIQNTGAGGIGTKFCDYITADSNTVSHTGYTQGWSSGISFNSHQWYDRFPGFHGVVINNIISGTYDGSRNHSDGNGIIMDLSTDSYDASTANTPPVLIANNVVYQNGGRCLNIYVVANIWIVNNTCYKNTLDLSNTFGELTSNKSKDSYFINNIAYAWNNNHQAFQLWNSSNILSSRNISYGGGLDGFPDSDPSQFLHADPRFTNPPYVDPTTDGQYATALPPDQFGDRLTLQAGSPAIDAGIDPTTIPGVSADIRAGLRQYVFKDITGKPRPQGSGFDIGAYEYGGSPAAAAPTGLWAR